jgi:RNA polymerase primary sigma factor
MGLGKNGVDWEGMALHDNSRYMEIRRVLSTELDDNLENMGDEELEYDFMDVVDGESTVIGAVGLEMLKSDLMKGLSTLTVREAKVLDMRFGLTDRVYTLNEVGETFRLSIERIRQLENKALRKMRNPKRSKFIRHHWSEIV